MSMYLPDYVNRDMYTELRLPHAPSRQVQVDAHDVQKQLDIEDMDHKSGASSPVADGSESGSTIERRIISFEKNDPDDPTQWPTGSSLFAVARREG
ncbi:hypothetical protein SLS58_000987 [Diplodia intermedia]|uniref:Uncharacterized protein n=1 Tax=Diplodia intermedia TaxID=856260 RepID=A0ABR3U3L4_9PEZI